MGEVTTIGIDLAKNVFQVHGIDADGRVILRRQLRRSQVLVYFADLSPCLVGMEACAGAHYWARELIALGHDVRLMPPSYVKPYVKRGSEEEKRAFRWKDRLTNGCRRRRGDLRSGDAALDAVRAGEDRRTAGHPGRSQHP